MARAADLTSTANLPDGAARLTPVSLSPDEPMTLAPSDVGRTLEKLYARASLGMQLGLDRMRAACARAGHPERAFDVVHVAGTNGKGSTAAMVEAVARAAGLRTGLYTSPHLCRFAERIRIDGESIGDDDLVRALEEAIALGPDLSFFETATLAAFLAFRAHAVDLAVVEVGIGGRFDATNVVERPRVTAITRVAFDHMDRLGNTLEDIAREKAGIAKPGCPLVVGPLPEGPMRVVENVARSVGAPIVRVAERPEALPAERALRGAYQGHNAAVARTIAAQLDFDDAAIARGLSTARWPGRFERIDRPDGPYLLDGAHNPDGARALAASLDGARALAASPGDARTPPPRLGSDGADTDGADAASCTLVFGAMADKAWPEVLDILAPLTTRRVYVAPKGRSAAPLDELARRHPGIGVADVATALQTARAQAGASGLVVVTGSLYLVGEARAILLGLPQDPPVAL